MFVGWGGVLLLGSSDLVSSTVLSNLWRHYFNIAASFKEVNGFATWEEYNKLFLGIIVLQGAMILIQK